MISQKCIYKIQIIKVVKQYIPLIIIKQKRINRKEIYIYNDKQYYRFTPEINCCIHKYKNCSSRMFYAMLWI